MTPHPFDINTNSGGFERLPADQSGNPPELQAGRLRGLPDRPPSSTFITATITAARGATTPAWFASTAQYNRLDADAAGRSLMQNSLGRLSMSYNSPTGYQSINNKSTAIFGQSQLAHLLSPSPSPPACA
jgi:hypothetical protein